MEDAIKKAEVLIEALPYIKKFRGKTFVIKYGGSILSESRIRGAVLEDIVFLYFTGINVILVHGGGPDITRELKKEKIKPSFVEGIRVTDEKTLDVVGAELAKLNSMLAEEIERLGAKTKGISGTENILYAEKKVFSSDLGLVGTVVSVNKAKLLDLAEKNHIVILSPMASGREGVVYNVNADEAASFIAGSLSVEKFVLLTDVKGVMRDHRDEGSLISSISEEGVRAWIKEKVISGGMIPKVFAGIQALDKGVKKAHIVDAKLPHALLLEIFTDKGIGTEIVRDADSRGLLT